MLSSGQSSKEHRVLRANADPPAGCLNNFFFSALSKKSFSGGGVGLYSGALQVPDSSMGSTVMLAGCVGARSVCTELGPAGNKVRSIPRAGDAQ